MNNYETDERLVDGTPIHIRAIMPDDRQRLLEHFTHLSERSVFLRFFGLKRNLSEDELTRLTQLDFVHQVGLAATLGQGDEERFIGVGRYVVDEPTKAPAKSAELAFAVLDEYQGHG